MKTKKIALYAFTIILAMLLVAGVMFSFAFSNELQTNSDFCGTQSACNSVDTSNMKMYVASAVNVNYVMLVNEEESTEPNPNEYTLTFDVDGGTEVAPITAAAGSAITAPTSPTKEGYEFKGWTLNGEAYEFTVMPSENLTLVAQWEAKTTATSNGSNNIILMWVVLGVVAVIVLVGAAFLFKTPPKNKKDNKKKSKKKK